MSDTEAPHDVNLFLVGIGHICLQWALIEQTLLAIIAAAEHIPLEKTYTRYGGTDMKARLAMAIRLAEEAKWSQPLLRRLRQLRKDVQNNIEERNLFVHGAHRGQVAPGEYELTMARWASNDRSHIRTADDAATLVFRLAKLAQEADSIFADYGIWKFGSEGQTDGSDKIVDRNAPSRLIRRRNIKRALKLLWANLRP